MKTYRVHSRVLLSAKRRSALWRLLSKPTALLNVFSELTQVDVDSREFEVDYRFSWRIGFARQWPHAKTVSSS